MTRRRSCFAAMLLPLCLAFIAPCTAAGKELVYGLDYRIRLQPGDDTAEVSVELGSNARLVREIRFRIVPGRQSHFGGDGKIEIEDRYVHWTPPASGGHIGFSVTVDHERDGGGYDALMTGSWAVFRGDDIVPAARVRTVKGAESRARLKLTGPREWTVVTPYPEEDDGWAPVEHRDRRFDRPTGWMAAGDLGVRRERIRGVHVIVAGPVDQGVRRMDMLAFLNWNLPELIRAFGDSQDRLLIVSAGDPMWRGGLSGPDSVFLHADRPLLSENGTSSLLHELVHTVLGVAAARDDDWIVEGLAEFYSLEIMRRSGTITGGRYKRGYDQLRQWSKGVDDLRKREATGAITARAVLVMRQADEEIRHDTHGKKSLDDVAREIVENGPIVSLRGFREIAARIAGKPLEALGNDRLQGVK